VTNVMHSSTMPAARARNIRVLDTGLKVLLVCDLHMLRGRLHVSHSAYDSPYDSVPDLHTKGSSVANLCPFKRTEHFREKRTSSHFFIDEKDTYLFFLPLY
jgi:hypothetical protein